MLYHVVWEEKTSMSIHIEHGYRARIKSIGELNDLMLEFSRQVETVARKAYQTKAAELAYRILDETLMHPTQELFLEAVRREYATGPIERPRPLIETDLCMVVSDIIADHQATIVRTQERDPEFDWTCHLSAIPHRTGLYVLLYAEQATYHKIWADLPGIEEYAYWNHTDPPDGMSQSRWERRRQRWNELLPEDGVPSKTGMTLTIYDPLNDWQNHFWDVEPDFIPDFEGRVQHWAFNQAVAEVWDRESPDNRGLGTIYRTRDWLKTPEGTEHWEALKQTIRETIPPTWDNALLHQTLGNIWASVTHGPQPH